MLLNTNSPEFGPFPFLFFSSWFFDDNLSDIVKTSWLTLTIRLTVFSKIVRLSRKLRILKKNIKAWRFVLNKKREEEVHTLKTKIVALDVLAEVIRLDDVSFKERSDTILKIQDL